MTQIATSAVCNYLIYSKMIFFWTKSCGKQEEVVEQGYFALLEDTGQQGEAIGREGSIILGDGLLQLHGLVLETAEVDAVLQTKIVCLLRNSD